eukprot:SAG22_NODE_7208_length_761_cov_2.503021_1_plen_65_part_01
MGTVPLRGGMGRADLVVPGWAMAVAGRARTFDEAGGKMFLRMAGRAGSRRPAGGVGDLAARANRP